MLFFFFFLSSPLVFEMQESNEIRISKMAALVRQCCRLVRPLSKLSPRYRLIQPVSFISTSKKNKDVITSVDPIPKADSLKKELEKNFADLDPKEDKVTFTFVCLKTVTQSLCALVK